jgi:hypothetical protein
VFSLFLSLSLVLVAAQGPPTSPVVPCIRAAYPMPPLRPFHRQSPRISLLRHVALTPGPQGISAKVGMPSSEPCPRPGAKDTSCTLRPCRALARAEPPQLRSSSGCKRYILNALLMLRTSGCTRYTLKGTCRLNVRAHSSSSRPLQSAAHASASTRSLCAPQRAHNAVSFCPVCSISSGQRPTSRAPAARRAPCYSLVWRFGGRALPPQLQRLLALSPPRGGRLPSALLRTTGDAAPSPARALRARSRCCRSFPPFLPPVSSRTKSVWPARSCPPAAAVLPESKKWGLHRNRQFVVASNKRPRVETAAPLTAVVYPKGLPPLPSL